MPKSWLKLLLLFACILSLIGLAGPALAKKRKKKKKKGISTLSETTNCKSRDQMYTFSPINPDDIVFIAPLGQLEPPANTFPTRHLYLHIRRQEHNNLNTPAVEVPVYAPANASVTEVAILQDIDDLSKTYNIKFVPCKGVEGYFLNVRSIAQNLQETIDSLPKTCTDYSTGGKNYQSCSYFPKTKVLAGEELGTTGGDMEHTALDFATFDRRAQAAVFANRDRWSSDKYVHTVCPLDYYAADLQTELYNKVGSRERNRIADPVCGTIAQDIKGTAQGVWILNSSDNKYPQDQHLALAYDSFDPGLQAFSVGDSLAKSGLKSGVYHFYPEDSGYINRNFADVTPDEEIYCYELDEMGVDNKIIDTHTVIIKEGTDNVLRVEAKEGMSCDDSDTWVFSSKFTEFKR